MHRQLQARLSLQSNQINYPKAMQNPHAYCVEVHLKGQLESVSLLSNSRDQLETTLTSVLQDNQGMQVLRYGINTRFYLLWAALKRTEWPLWLKQANADVQVRYTELEASKDQYLVDYQSASEACFSFKDYVQRTFSEWADRVLGEQLDPQSITVRSSYTLQIAGRTIDHEETRTLTEFIVFGLHDNGYRASLSITGVPSASRLTPAALEQWLVQRNLRLDFVSDLASSPSVAYQQAYRDYFFGQMQFELFVARHSGDLTDTDARIIARAMASDSSVAIHGLKIRLQAPALKDVLVFTAEGYSGCLLFLRSPEGPFKLHKFADVFAMNRWIEAALSASREYAALLVHLSICMTQASCSMAPALN